MELDPSITAQLPDNTTLITSLLPSLSPTATSEECPCFMTAYMKRLILSTKGFPKATNMPEKQVYDIAASPGKDPGMFSAKKIEVGEMICDERSLLVLPMIVGAIVGNVGKFLQGRVIEPAMLHQVILAEAEKVLRACIEDRGRMTKKNMEALLALHNSHLHDGSGPIVGVIRTNAFVLSETLRDKGSSILLDNPASALTFIAGASLIQAGDTGVYAGVWKTLSRINHR